MTKATHNLSVLVGGYLDIHKLIGKLPKPKHGWLLFNHNYCGPFNPLDKQLDKDGRPLPGQEPYNQVDAICLEHDRAYDKATSKGDKHAADQRMLEKLGELKPKNFRERVDKAITKTSLEQSINSA